MNPELIRRSQAHPGILIPFFAFFKESNYVRR
jgi:hypothetical protein